MEPEIIAKHIEEIPIAGIRFIMNDPTEQLGAKLNEIEEIAKDYIVGPPILVYHFDTIVQGGADVEACYPIKSEMKETHGDVEVRTLKAADIFSLTFNGPRKTLGGHFSRLTSHMYSCGHASSQQARVIHHVVDNEKPENNVFELQAFPHEWDRLLAQNVERMLGTEATKRVMTGHDEITLSSSSEERGNWVRNALIELETISEDAQMQEIVAGCAHVYPDENIAVLREIYEENNDIEDVIRFMIEGEPKFISTPTRKGNVLYYTKVFQNPKGYEEAETDEEKRVHACHCPLIKNHMNKGTIPPKFCYCGIGWFQRMWTGILDKPLRIEMISSALNGDKDCTFAVYLPEN